MTHKSNSNTTQTQQFTKNYKKRMHDLALLYRDTGNNVYVGEMYKIIKVKYDLFIKKQCHILNLDWFLDGESILTNIFEKVLTKIQMWIPDSCAFMTWFHIVTLNCIKAYKIRDTNLYTKYVDLVDINACTFNSANDKPSGNKKIEKYERNVPNADIFELEPTNSTDIEIQTHNIYNNLLSESEYEEQSKIKKLYDAISNIVPKEHILIFVDYLHGDLTYNAICDKHNITYNELLTIITRYKKRIYKHFGKEIYKYDNSNSKRS